jgi:hypothetical protein
MKQFFKNLGFTVLFLAWPILIAGLGLVVGAFTLDMTLYRTQLILIALIALTSAGYLSAIYFQKHKSIYPPFLLGMSSGAVLTSLVLGGAAIYELPMCRYAQLSNGYLGMCGLFTVNAVTLSFMFIIGGALVGFLAGFFKKKLPRDII